MFFTGNLFHTAGKEILVGISVDIFNRSFLILINRLRNIFKFFNLEYVTLVDVYSQFNFIHVSWFQTLLLLVLHRLIIMAVTTLAGEKINKVNKYSKIAKYCSHSYTLCSWITVCPFLAYFFQKVSKLLQLSGTTYLLGFNFSGKHLQKSHVMFERF